METMNSPILFSEEVKIQRWTGYNMALFSFRSGNELIQIVVPESTARKISTSLDYLEDDSET